MVTAANAPQRWCEPPAAFGQLNEWFEDKPVKTRKWLRPSPKDPVRLAQFRAAVMQNAICVAIRSAKNDDDGSRGERLSQAAFARKDPRPDSEAHWNAVLNGRVPLSTQDIAMVTVMLPGALPSEAEIREFLDVAEKRTGVPSWWEWPDRPR
jgi:hypothetical protein